MCRFEAVFHSGAQTAMPEAEQNFDLPSGDGSQEGLYELQKMNELHHEIVRQKMGDPTQSNKEIAERLGVSQQTVNYTLNSEIVQEKMAVLRGQADADALNMRKQLRSLTPMAVRVLADVAANSDKDAQRRLAASDILDRVPETSKHSHQHRKNDDAQLDEDELNEIKELGKQMGVVEDANYEDIEEPNETPPADRTNGERGAPETDGGDADG